MAILPDRSAARSRFPVASSRFRWSGREPPAPRPDHRARWRVRGECSRPPSSGRPL